MSQPGSTDLMPPRKLTYIGIADDLAARIAAGEYPAELPIPSYAQIAVLYEVSRSTAQQAIRLLRDRGIVEGVRGRGVYIAEPAAYVTEQGGTE